MGRAGSEVASKESAAELRLVKGWRADMAVFVEQAILGPHNRVTGKGYGLTNQQREGCAALTRLVQEKVQGKSREILGISIMSGRGTGKDAWAAWAILWFLSCFSYPKIPCVSVSADQLNKVLWSELAKWLMHSPLRDQFRLQNDKLYCATVPTEARGKRWLAFPKAANPRDTFEEQVETLAGIHERHLLQVVDEGSGVLDGVFQVLEGNMTGEVNVMLLIFNPTRSMGYAIATQETRSDRWIPLHWNAEESELVDRTTIERMAEDFGKDSNTYRVRVLGLPPTADEQTLIPWDWIEDAIGRPVEVPAGVPLVKGVDCGAGGDNSVIATRKGPLVYPFKRLRSADSTVLRNWIGTDIDAERPDAVRIDTIGIGWRLEGELREQKGPMIEAADFRRQADAPEQYFNKRAESYGRMRDVFQAAAISLPPDPALQNQLGATRCEYRRSQLKIIDKAKIKQAIGHSPDEADALALTFFSPDSLVSRMLVARRRERPRAERGSAQAWMGA